MAINRNQYRNAFQPLTKETPQGFNRGEARHRLDHQLFSGLGYDGNSPKEQYRFYELNERGEMKSPFADGTTYDSDAFLDKIAQGRIVAFPMGEKHPVQLSFEGGEVNFSTPLESLPIFPKPQEPMLSGWKRFANAITFGRAYRKDKAEYDRELAAYREKMVKWKKDQAPLWKKVAERTPEVLKQETKQYDAEVTRREEAENQAALQTEREKARKQYDDLQAGKLTAEVDVFRNTLKKYYGPKPIFDAEFCGSGAGKSYTKEEFDQLKDYSQSIEGMGISADEFTALSMFKAFDPEIGGKYDPEGSVGLTPEEVASGNLSMFTDTVNQYTVRPRDSHGKVFGWVVEPARNKTVEAIQAYKDGYPEKLGELIGRGMHVLSNHSAGKDTGNDHFLSVTATMGEALNVLERDPALMAEAKKTMKALAQKDDPEATPKELDKKVQRSLDLANGQRVALELAHKNEKAKVMLHAESMGICKLTPEQRKQCVDDRLAYEIVRENTTIDINDQYDSDLFKNGHAEKGTKVAEAAKRQDMEAYNHAQAAFESFEDNTIRAPQAVVLMGSGKLKPEMMVDSRIQNKNKLYALSGAELENALKGDKLLARNSPYVKKPKQDIVQQKTMETTKNVTKNVTKNKTVGGPGLGG